MSRPKINIKYQTIDYLIELLGIIAFICLIVLPIYFYNDLPDKIPKHFNLYGHPDAYGKKGIIWLLPAIGLLIYVGLTLLNRIPQYFNYPTTVTSENAHRLYQIATRTVRILKIIVVVTFSFLNFNIIKIGLDESANLSMLFLPVVFLTTLGVVGLMIYKMIKK